MASSLALRRAASSSLINKLFHPIRAASASTALSSFNRSFATNTQMTAYDDDGDNRDLDVDRRRDSSVSRGRGDFFSDAFDPFSPTRSLSQILNAMDHFMENPFTNPTRGLGFGARPGWHAKEDDSSLSLRFDMPGFDKEDVKISVEQNTLIIKGEGREESDDGEEPSTRKYSSRLDLPPNVYKFDEIKAELKNGVLKIRVPKVKEEERKDVRQVTIE